MANNTNWLNISSQSGSSGQTILTLSANKNLSTNYKTAEITAYNPVYNISAKTYVTLESYAPILATSPALFGVPDSGGTYELTISANCAWVIAFPDLVSSFSTSAGSGNAVVTFTVPGTTANTTLVGNIVVTDESGQISRVSRVEQYGSGVHIGVFPVELYFDSTGGSKTFSVTADCAYNVSMNNTDWAFVEPHSGYTGQTTFTVTVNGENTGNTDIVGSISIDAPGQTLPVIIYHKKPETRLVATYYVTSTTDPTSILQYTSSFSKAEYPDGTEIELGTGYTFPTTGYQTVYYTLTGTTIGGFGNTTVLTSVVIPKGVTAIAPGAFLFCSGLTSVTIPNTVTQLGTSSFYQCTSLSSITLPDSLQTIDGSAFRNCTSLSSITIPSGVTSIGAACFTDSSVSSITFTSLTPPTLGNTDALTSNTLSEIIVPCPAVNDYITAWPQYAQYISCQDTGTTLYFVTDTSNVKGIGETRTITILNTNVNSNDIGLSLPSDFPQQGSYTVDGMVIYLTYPRNPSSSATRSWTIGVVATTKDGVNLSGSYNITQNANITYSIPYTADTSTVDASGETRTITIDTSNLVASSITIGVEGATGVTYTYDNGVITITFPENSGFEQYINVNIDGTTLDGNSATASISFVQDGEYIIPTGEDRLIVIYNVTSSTQSTPILALTGSSNSFTKAEVNGTSSITMTSSYRFPRTGKQAIFYTLKDNILGREGSASVGFGGDFYNIASIDSVIIPSSVTIVTGNCFSHCSNLTSITIPDSVIEFGGLSNCTSLRHCVLPGNLEKLGDSTFSWCTSLEDIVIPDSVNSLLRSTFYHCTSLTSVTIGSGITDLGGGIDDDLYASCDIFTDNYYFETANQAMCFAECTSLARIDIPNNVTQIPNSCFCGCTSLSTVNIGTGVLYIGSSAFKGCTSLNNFTMPNNIVSLGNNVFQNCTMLSNIALSQNLYSLGGGQASTGGVGTVSGNCFQDCTSLSTISVPIGVKKIGANCFSGCTSLRNVTVSANLREIGNYAFRNCTNLTGLVLPNYFSKLGDYVFFGCTSFTSLTTYAVTVPTTSYFSFQGVATGGVLKYPAGSDYSTWLSTSNYYLGSYGWTGQTL